jgi:hypothetical protein
MKVMIEDVVMQFKHDIRRCLSAEFIVTVCQTLGYVWRDRQLGPVATIQGFLLQILQGNTGCSEVPRLLGKAVSGEAYGQAGNCLPPELFQQLLKDLCARLQGYLSDTDKWLGHRVWVVDGSSCSMPDVPALQQAFGQPPGQAPGCGFPVAHLMALFHFQTGMLQRIVAAPMRTHDQTQARRMHDEFSPGDVVLADRGFCSFWHLAQLSQAGVHAVFRIHQAQIVSFRKGRMHVPPSPPFPERRDLRFGHSCQPPNLGRLGKLPPGVLDQRGRWSLKPRCGGRPRGLSVLPRSSRNAVAWTQARSPNGWPRRAHVRRAASSASV